MPDQTNTKPTTDTRFLAVALIISLIFLGIFFFVRTKSEKVKSNPQASPAPAPALSEKGRQIKAGITKTEKTAGDLKSDYPEYTIRYLISNDEFMVTIKKAPFADSKKLAEQWFLGHGFQKEELCALKIYFVPSTNVDFNINTDSYPTGCNK